MPADSKAVYIARTDGWVAGKRVKRGDEVSLTAAEAKYEPVDPLTVDAQANRPRLPKPGTEAPAS